MDLNKENVATNITIIRSDDTERTMKHYSTKVDCKSLLVLHDKDTPVPISINALTVNRRDEVKVVAYNLPIEDKFQIDKDVKVVYITFNKEL